MNKFEKEIKNKINKINKLYKEVDLLQKEKKKNDYTKRTFSIRVDLYEKLRLKAYEKRLTQTSIIESLLETL